MPGIEEEKETMQYSQVPDQFRPLSFDSAYSPHLEPEVCPSSPTEHRRVHKIKEHEHDHDHDHDHHQHRHPEHKQEYEDYARRQEHESRDEYDKYEHHYKHSSEHERYQHYSREDTHKEREKSTSVHVDHDKTQSYSPHEREGDHSLPSESYSAFPSTSQRCAYAHEASGQNNHVASHNEHDELHRANDVERTCETHDVNRVTFDKHEDDEMSKRAILLDLQQLSMQPGVKLTKEWTMTDRMDDMLLELQRHTLLLHEREGVTTLRDGLHIAVTAIEKINKQYGFLDLEGWSASVLRNVHKYDYNLSRIYRKWWKRGHSTSPEVDMAIAIFGSMTMHHLQRSMTREMMNAARKTHFSSKAKRTANGRMPYDNSSSDDEGPPPPPQVPKHPAKK